MSDHRRCKELLHSLSDYIDGELAPRLCAEIERHMAECGNCRIVVDTLRKTIFLYQQTASEYATLPGEARERLFRALHIPYAGGHDE